MDPEQLETQEKRKSLLTNLLIILVLAAIIWLIFGTVYSGLAVGLGVLSLFGIRVA